MQRGITKEVYLEKFEFTYMTGVQNGGKAIGER